MQESPEGESAPIRRHVQIPDLRGDGPFVRFWLAHTVTVTGTTVSSVLLPILVFERTGSPAQTSLVVAFAALPYLLLGLVAGAVADRSDRRRLMVGCELASAALVASVPAAAAFDALTLPHIYLVALGTATSFVWFDAANFGALPALVGRDRLVAATSALQSAEGVAYIVGPTIGGVLATAIGPATAMTVDAASYVVSGAGRCSACAAPSTAHRPGPPADPSGPRSAKGCAGSGSIGWSGP